MFLSSKFDIIKVIEASHILIAFLIGLSFAAINKILLALYYSLNDTKTPAFIAVAATIVNFIGNCFMLSMFQATGLAYCHEYLMDCTNNIVYCVTQKKV